MNIKQWEETPLSSASKKECLENVRRQYVETLTQEFVRDVFESSLELDELDP